MDGIMIKIAFKVSHNIPNLPDGFIIDHFETDKDIVEGYTVTSHEIFEKLLENNVSLMRTWEKNNGIVTADSNIPPPPPRPSNQAEPLSQEQLAARKKAQQDAVDNTKLFQEFLAWKKSQTSGS
jgi:hypothetical protein